MLKIKDLIVIQKHKKSVSVRVELVWELGVKPKKSGVTWRD